MAATAASSTPRVLLITLAIGERYLEVYTALFRPSHEAYAARHGYDFAVVTDFLDQDCIHRSLITMQKFLVASQPWSAPYDYVIFIDADTIINSQAPPIHLAAPFGDAIGLVDEYAQPTRAECIKFHADAGWEVTGKEYYALCGIDFDSDIVLNSGLIVFQPAKHAALMREIYASYYEKQVNHPRGALYEQTVLSYELQRRGLALVLPNTWNSVWVLYKKEETVPALQTHVDAHWITHFAGRVDYEKVPAVHFAGGLSRGNTPAPSQDRGACASHPGSLHRYPSQAPPPDPAQPPPFRNRDE
jgi:hypothetical protein